MARGAMAKVREKYGDKVRIVYKQYIVHEDVAVNPGRAACAAHKQGKFEAMDRVLWEKGFAGGRDFSAAKLTAMATDAGLDVPKFEADLAECGKSVERDHAQLLAVGQGATPTFYINGRTMVGVAPLEKLSAVIDEELAKAEARIKDGTARADYYRTWVLEKGEKRYVPTPQT
jgi:protein-disulfide isomerase